MKTNMVKMSFAAALLLGSSAYAGKIVTNADLNDVTVLDNQQFGFGGWNLDNVNVKIVSTNDFNVSLSGTSFDKGTGVYTPMEVGRSFESEIYNIIDHNANTIGTTIMGRPSTVKTGL